MAKNIESLEEDDFLLDESNSNNEDQIIEEEDENEETALRFRPRPARASLTHNAIKSEILKMNKQNRQESSNGEDGNDENLSRSARKRKKRREKILEERRQSGGRNFEDDLDHFKSIPISRRRSSVLPLNSTITLPNHNDDDSFLSKLKCIFWVILVVSSLIGLVMILPGSAELDLAEPTINQNSNEDQLQPEQSDSINNQIDQGEQILNNINKLNDELNNQEDDNQIDNNQDEEESLSTFSYISSFFATEDSPPSEQNQDEQNEEITIDENEQNNDDATEEPITPPSYDYFSYVQNDDSNEGEINVEENQAVEENNQQTAEQNEDNLVDEQLNSCIIGNQIYDNLDENQCSILQERQRDLEQRLREHEQSIREQQQQEEQQEKNDEQFYFF